MHIIQKNLSNNQFVYIFRKECIKYIENKQDPNYPFSCWCGAEEYEHFDYEASSKIYLPPHQTTTSKPSIVINQRKNSDATTLTDGSISENDEPDYVSTYEKVSEKLWKYNTHIKELPTNAFGYIEFIENSKSNKPAKYVRVSNDTDMESIGDLLQSEWDLARPHKPSLIISVVGGAKNFSLNGRRKQTFNQGLIKVSEKIRILRFTDVYDSKLSKNIVEYKQIGLGKFEFKFLRSQNLLKFENINF